jgi:membrane protein DedA with SNARE-associated domain
MHTFLIQIPQGVPHPDTNTPLQIREPFDVVLYIIIPLLVLLGYILWRKREKERKQD